MPPPCFSSSSIGKGQIPNTMDPSSSCPPPHSHKTPPPRLHKKTKFTHTFLYTITSILLIITFQSLALLKSNSPPAQTPHHHQSPTEHPQVGPTFHPLKDPRVPPYTHPNKTWFMSTLTGHSLHGMPEHFTFPSHPPHNMTLCMNTYQRSYTLIAAGHAFPPDSTVLPGLTFVADSFYDYENPWHSLNALSVFFSWMMKNGCTRPARFVVFKSGRVVKNVGGWISELMKACLGSSNVVFDSLERYESACFEKAVIFRRGLGKMSSERRHGLFEMIRCKCWDFCNATIQKDISEGDNKGVRITLIGRDGKRAFRNESGVKLVMERECNKVSGCTLKLVHLKNMSFCDQVQIMRNTDVLATAHGAQLTNMMFMPKGSSVMEMFPKGWLEGAGIGQYIYQWFASWSEMNYEGAWRDTDGLDCPGPEQQRSRCFLKQKDQPVGLNETFLADWTARVIQTKTRTSTAGNPKPCSCDDPTVHHMP